MNDPILLSENMIFKEKKSMENYFLLEMESHITID